MEVEHCIQADGEEIRNFFHCIKKTVDKGWPDDMAGVEAAEQAAERTAQARQRRQRYIDYTLKGLRPKISTTKRSGIFDGTSKCNLERFYIPPNEQRRILSSLY